MKINNLIYNKLGNSLSLMLETEDQVVQLHDEVKFHLDDLNVNVYGISTLEKDKLIFGIDINNLSFLIKIFEKNNLYIKIKDDLMLEFIDDYFIYPVSKDDFGTVMNIFKQDLAFTKVETSDDRYILKVGSNNFLKGIAQVLRIKRLV